MDQGSRPEARDAASFAHYADTTLGLAHLATFPEQNPNAVVETDMAGSVTYLNPEAKERFPDLGTRGIDHPLLAGILDTVAGFRRQGLEFVQRQVEVEGAVFEQKVCYSAAPGAELIRVYSHDVTAHLEAEMALADMARRVVTAQEEERKRVSRELHDEAGQALAALKISLQLLGNDADADSETLRRNLREAVDLVDTTREQIRLLAHDLRPPALDALGLNDTLEDFCQEFGSRTRLAINYVGTDVQALDDAEEICVYRLLQEALANVAMHAQAQQVSVTLRQDADCVSLHVADDGRGMDLQILEESERAGLGIVGMRERVEMLGGQLVITSCSEGTELSATLPAR